METTEKRENSGKIPAKVVIFPVNSSVSGRNFRSFRKFTEYQCSSGRLTSPGAIVSKSPFKPSENGYFIFAYKCVSVLLVLLLLFAFLSLLAFLLFLLVGTEDADYLHV